VQWHTPIVSVNQDAEARISVEPSSSRSARATQPDHIKKTKQNKTKTKNQHIVQDKRQKTSDRILKR
jgi:hypothetical protein